MSGKGFGTAVARLEDPDLLRGKGRFVDDLHLPGLLQAAFVRSQHGHARIRKIDTGPAVALPGVHAVYTAADFRPHLVSERLVVGLPSPAYRQDINRPVLAESEAVHVGEAIAIVVADDRYIAEDAAALVDVDYAPLPAVADPRAALAPGSPTAHAGSPHNLLAEFDIAFGDVAAAFAGAPHVIAEKIWLHRGGGHSIECRGTVASYDGIEDRLTVWSSTQMPHAAQRLLCDLMGRDENQVRVITPDVGGGFGPKLVFYPEDISVALAARLLGRPVKWIEDRREHFVATTQERDQYWTVEMALDAEARIRGIRGSLVHDHGAYTARGVNLPYESAQTVTLAYEVPAYALNVKLALTNKVPVTPVRGAGQPQGAFVMERLLDRAAQELGLDRAEIRRRNLVAADKMPREKPLKSRGGMQVVLDSGNYPECQRLALERIGWDSFPARRDKARGEGIYLGIGLGNFVKGTGRGPFEPVTVRVAPSGKIHVYTGAAAMGQGTKTMLAQVVAEQLGGRIEDVTVTAGDTAAIAMGMGGFNSRQAVMAGSSAHLAAVKLRDKALAVASQLLEAAAADLEIAEGAVRVKGAAQMRVTLGDIARSVSGVAGFALPAGTTPGLETTESFVRDEMAFANGTAAVELEVDPETGAVAIRRLVIAHDCGTVINPMIVDGQIIGGAAHGIGNALYEWMGFDEHCQPVTATLAEYLLVTATEMPRVEIIHQESPTYLNPLGVKGVGECGVLPVIPAVISALEDALAPFKVRLSQAPVSPADIVAAIERAKAQ
jgi:aerobic carbon-monoxide dehydrogenase large subunit